MKTLVAFLALILAPLALAQSTPINNPRLTGAGNFSGLNNKPAVLSQLGVTPIVYVNDVTELNAATPITMGQLAFRADTQRFHVAGSVTLGDWSNTFTSGAVSADYITVENGGLLSVYDGGNLVLSVGGGGVFLNDSAGDPALNAVNRTLYNDGGNAVFSWMTAPVSETAFIASNADAGKVRIGSLPGDTNYSGLWTGSNAETPDSTNYGFLSNGVDTLFNSPSGVIQFRIGNVTAVTVSGSLLTSGVNIATPKIPEAFNDIAQVRVTTTEAFGAAITKIDQFTTEVEDAAGLWNGASSQTTTLAAGWYEFDIDTNADQETWTLYLYNDGVLDKNLGKVTSQQPSFHGKFKADGTSIYDFRLGTGTGAANWYASAPTWNGLILRRIK